MNNKNDVDDDDDEDHSAICYWPVGTTAMRSFAHTAGKQTEVHDTTINKRKVCKGENWRKLQQETKGTNNIKRVELIDDL